jgi:hypothetical protein
MRISGFHAVMLAGLVCSCWRKRAMSDFDSWDVCAIVVVGMVVVWLWYDCGSGMASLWVVLRLWARNGCVVEVSYSWKAG